MAQATLVACGGGDGPDRKLTFSDVCTGDMFESTDGSVWQKYSDVAANQIQNSHGVMDPVNAVFWKKDRPIKKIAHERFRITL